MPGGTCVQGLSALELDHYRDVALIYAPDATEEIAQRIIAHCENQSFRFAVIDSKKGTNDSNKLNPRNTITDSPNAAFLLSMDRCA